MKNIDDLQSKRIWEIKAISIFTVFFAYMPWLDNNLVMIKLFSLIGITGVPIFLFLSGYLSYGKQPKWKSKFNRLFIPVLFWGTISFIFSKIIKHEIFLSEKFIIDWMLYLLGSRSIYYFITVLICCIILFNNFNKWVLIIISFISIICGDTFIFHNEYFTRYLNPFNFLFYFQIGSLVREYEFQFDNALIEFSLGLCFCLSSWFLFDQTPSYFSIYCITNAVGAFLLLDSLLHFISYRILIYLGKISFVIYLMHISLASYLNSRLQGEFQYLKVFFAFAIVSLFVFTLDIITRNISCLKRYRSILGFR